jgi:hypothetical protein
MLIGYILLSIYLIGFVVFFSVGVYEEHYYLDQDYNIAFIIASSWPILLPTILFLILSSR